MASLGDLSASISIDVNSAQTTLNQFQRQLDGLERKLAAVEKGKVDVTPKGVGELDKAVTSAGRLEGELNDVSSAAQAIKLESRLASDLERIDSAAGGAASGMESAASSAGKLAGESEQAATAADKAAKSSKGIGGAAPEIDRAAGSMSNLIKVAKELLPAISVSALGGTILSSGWSRLTSIDDARTKLTGLGNEAKDVESIMDNAMNAVKGTAFGFGDAATVASGMVASGVESGKELEMVLTTVADTAAISGRSLEEVGAIFNKIAASGKIQGEELNQLADAGIPVLQLLSQELGVTVEEVRKMASEGEIGFSTFEAAMRSGMGGAAKAGDSVSSALANVQAALGRLGAASLEGTFSAMPGVLSGVTAGIDGLTSGVEGLSEWFGKLPAPVQELIGGLTTLKVTTSLLGTELGQQLVGKVKELGEQFLGLGDKGKNAFSALAGAYREGRAPLLEMAAGHREAQTSARDLATTTDDAFTGIGAVIRAESHGSIASLQGLASHGAGALNTLKTGAKGVIDFFGGPWAVGIGAAAAVVTTMIRESQQLDTAHENMAVATRDAASAQSELRAELVKTNGAMSDQAIAAGAKIVKGELSEIIELGGTMQDTFNVLEAPDLSWWQQGFWNEDFQKYRAEMGELEKQYATLEDTMVRLGIPMEDLNSIVAAGGSEYNNLVNALVDAGGAGIDAANGLREARQEMLEAASVAAMFDEEWVGITEGMNQMADAGASAAEQIDGLRLALESAGLITGNETENAIKYAEALEEVAAKAKEAFNTEEGADPLGAALLTDAGTINIENDNARVLHDQMMELSTAFDAAVTSGKDAQEAWNEATPTLDALAEATGLSREQIDELANSYGMLPEEYTLYLDAQGAGDVAADLASVHLALRDAEEGAVIPIEVDEDGAGLLEALGYDLEYISDGIYEVNVDADTADAQDELAEVMGLAGRLADQDIEPKLLLDDTQLNITASEAESVLNWLDIQDPSPEADLIIDKLRTNKDISVGELVTLAGENPTPIADLNNQGLLSKVTTSTSAVHGMNDVRGESHIGAETSGFDRAINWVKQQLNRLPGVNIPITATASMGGGSGKFADGGLVGLADGGKAYGYKLPMTGPGTDRTDGILGVGSDGVPTAWVDRGEFVTNRDATSRWEDLLWAINSNDPARIAAVAAGSLTRLALGGLADGGTAPTTAGGSAPTGGGTSIIDSLRGGLDAVPGEVDTEVTAQVDGALEELAKVTTITDKLGEGVTSSVTVMNEGAISSLTDVTKTLDGVPDSTTVEVDADLADADETVTEFSDTLATLGEGIEPIAVTAEMDTDGLEDSVATSTAMLDDLGMVETVPTANLDTAGLDYGVSDSHTSLDGLDSRTPIPTADLNHAPLDGGVAHSEAELQRVGASRAVSVSDVDNSSALANIQGVINELNKMPVERVIKVVAHGTTGLFQGGQVPGLATGGQAGYKLPTSGPGTNVTDGFLGVDGQGMPLVRVNAGEWVINDASSEKYHQELAMINAGTFPKLDNLDMLAKEARRAPGLFKGGVVSPDQLLSFARGNTVNGATPPGSLEGSPYIWGGGLLANWGDCSGAMSGLAALATGMNVAGRKFATMNQGPVLASMGFRPGLGDPATSFNLGWFNGGPWGGHTAGTIGGTNVEMGGGRGNGQIGGAAAGAADPSFTDHAHIPLGELVAMDYFSALPNVTTRRVMPGAGGFFGTGGHGVTTGGNGVFLHDTGGWHMPGTFSYNGLKEPEAILTPPQWGDLSELVDVLKTKFPQAADQIEGAANALEAVATADGDVVRGVGNKFVDIAGVLGWDTAADTTGALLTAEQDLADARAENAARLADIKAKENDLAQAREELSAAQAVPDGMSVDDTRKLADAEKALADARADGDAEKITDAEEKLKRTREDISENAVKNEEKRADDIVKATENVTKAEGDLAEARAESVRALDEPLYKYVPQLSQGLSGAANMVKGLVGQASGVGGAALQAIPALNGVASQLAMAAGLAGPAGVSLGVALQAVQTALEVAKALYELVEGIMGFFSKVRVAEAELYAQVAESMADMSDVVSEQRELVAGLKLQMVDASIAVQQAAWDVRTSQIGVMQAQLEGILQVATAEEALAAERARINGRQLYDFQDLAVAYDKYIQSLELGFEVLDNATGEGQVAFLGYLEERLAAEESLSQREKQLLYDAFQGRFDGLTLENATLQESREYAEAYRVAELMGMEDRLEAAHRITPELLALQSEVQAAEIGRALLIRQASLDALTAAKNQADATRNLAWLTEDLARAQSRLSSMNDLGMGTDEAMLQAEIAKLTAQNAEFAATMDNLGNKVGNFFDFDGDGKAFGLFDNKGSQQTQAAQAGIEANNALIAQYQQRLTELGYESGSASVSDADRRIYEMAARLKADGQDELAEALLRSTASGAAIDQLQYQDVMQRVDDYLDRQTQLERDIEQGLADQDYLSESLSMEQMIYAMELMQQALQYEADGLRAGNDGVRDANYELADYLAGVATDLGAPVGALSGSADYLAVSAELLAGSVDSLADRAAASLPAGTDRPANGGNVTVVKLELADGALYSAESLRQAFNNLDQAGQSTQFEVDLIKKQLTDVSPVEVRYSRAGR